MPKLRKPIRDTELLEGVALSTVRIDLTPETYATINELVRRKLYILELGDSVGDSQKGTNSLTRHAAMERARSWIISGNAPANIVRDIRAKSFYRTREESENECLEAFLSAHPNVKVVEKRPGRPKGMSPEARKRMAWGLVIADLINEAPTHLGLRKILQKAA